MIRPAALGSRTVTVRPPSGFARNCTNPWCARATDRTMVSPNPNPSGGPRRACAARWKGSNSAVSRVWSTTGPVLWARTTAFWFSVGLTIAAIVPCIVLLLAERKARQAKAAEPAPGEAIAEAVA